MQLKTIAAVAITWSTVITLPLQAAQPATPNQVKLAASHDATIPKKAERTIGQSAPKQRVKKVDTSSNAVLHEADPQLRQIHKRPQVSNLEPAVKQLTPPVITEPTSGYICCAQRQGQNVSISSELNVSGEGLPGHLIRLRVELKNGDSRSTITNERVRVDDDGRWRVRWLEVSASDVHTNSAFIEINATQYFPATQVRQEDDEAHAEPVFLRYRTPPRHPLGATSTSGH
jgi:hypothetical protein